MREYRILSGLKVQSAEDPGELLSETDRVYARFLELISAINRTDSQTAFDNERRVYDPIAERDVVGKGETLWQESPARQTRAGTASPTSKTPSALVA